MVPAPDLRGSGDGSAAPSWAETYERLASVAPEDLSARDLEALAEAAWWLLRGEEAIGRRRGAYSAYASAGDDRGAARQAWDLFYEHLYRGEQSVALGWLRRVHRHLEQESDCAEKGYLAFAESELALFRAEFAESERLAAEAVSIGQRCRDADVVAMGLQLQGRALAQQGRLDEGMALLDEAMVLVLADQLTPFFVGAVYCAVIHACRDLGDLRRAGEWTRAAREWCTTLPSPTPYHGICRVYRGEVLCLLGAWDEAEAEVRKACDELYAFKPGAATEGYAAMGELLRRRGDEAGAEEAFGKVRELGGDPQPGLALLRLAQGRTDTALTMLRSALDTTIDRPHRARLLWAQARAAAAAGDLGLARTAAEGLGSVAEELPGPVLEAMAASARGVVLLAESDHQGALSTLRRVARLWRDVGLPYEEADARLLAGTGARDAGDEEAARVEIEAARAGFERLGAKADARRAAELLGAPPAAPAGLTAREVEVLRLVAAGKSNREIAEVLVISEHTVARHLQNIFTKLGVASRAAATAFAFEHELV